jgi:hypothetical protein
MLYERDPHVNRHPCPTRREKAKRAAKLAAMRQAIRDAEPGPEPTAEEYAAFCAWFDAEHAAGLRADDEEDADA